MKLQIRPIPELQSWASVRGNGLLLANGLGVKPPTVSDWVTGKKAIPLDKVTPIEQLTESVVTRRHMRPLDYLVHWPELAQAEVEPAQDAIKTIAQNAVLPSEDKLPNHVIVEAIKANLIKDRRVFVRRAEDRKRLGLDIGNAGQGV